MLSVDNAKVKIDVPGFLWSIPSATDLSTLNSACVFVLWLLLGIPYTAPAQVGTDFQSDIAASLGVGQRCCVEPGERRGEIK